MKSFTHFKLGGAELAKRMGGLRTINVLITFGYGNIKINL
jgi:hypothetical protein